MPSSQLSTQPSSEPSSQRCPQPSTHLSGRISYLVGNIPILPTYTKKPASLHLRAAHPEYGYGHHHSPAISHLANNLLNSAHSNLASCLYNHQVNTRHYHPLSAAVSNLADHLNNPVHSNLVLSSQSSGQLRRKKPSIPLARYHTQGQQNNFTYLH